MRLYQQRVTGIPFKFVKKKHHRSLEVVDKKEIRIAEVKGLSFRKIHFVQTCYDKPIRYDEK